MKMLNDELSLDRWVAVDRKTRDVVQSELYWMARSFFNDQETMIESLRDDLDTELALRGY